MTTDYLLTGAFSGLGESITKLLLNKCDIRVFNIDENYELTMISKFFNTMKKEVVDSNKVKLNVNFIIDCGFSDHQSYIKEDMNGDLMVDSMKNNVSKLYYLDNTFGDMLRYNKGIFIGIGSNAAYTPMTASSNYCMNKAAYEMWFKVRAREEDRLQGKFKSIDGDYVSYICINPILIDDTQMPNNLMNETMKLRNWTKEQTYNDYHKHCHNGISLKVNPTAKFITDLCDRNYEFSRSLNGTVLNIGGNL